MDKQKKLNILGQVCLVSAIIVWGASFVVLKETIKTVPTFYVIAIRFLLSAIILALIFIKKTIKIKFETFIHGVILGLFLSGAYLAQTIGLLFTTPARNAFLTSAYCVMCPFMIWLLFKFKPELKNIVSAILAIVGIGFVALSGDNSNGGNTLLGDGLTLVGAVFFAFQIVFIDKYQKSGDSAVQLLIPQILTVGVIFTFLTLTIELPTRNIIDFALNGEQLLKVAFLTLVCTLFAQTMQIIGQKYATPTQASIILSGEAVFGTLFSLVLGYERLTIWLIVGFVIIFFAMLLTELDVKNILKKKNSLKLKIDVDENKN